MPIVPGSIPGGSLNRTLSKFPKILFLNEDALAIVKSEASHLTYMPYGNVLKYTFRRPTEDINESIP